MPEIYDPSETESIFGKNVQGTATLKWKFFMMSSIFKLSTSSSSNIQRFPILFIILDLLASLAPSTYYLLNHMNFPVYYDDYDLDIFPANPIFSIITPFIISRILFLFIMAIFFIFSCICFLVCFKNPGLAYYFGPFLNMGVHALTVPLQSATLTYVFYYFNYGKEQDTVTLILCIVILIFFIPYFCIFVFVCAASAVSIINPSVLYTMWFSTVGYIYPIYFYLTSCFSYALPRVAETVQISLCIVNIILSAALLVYYFIEMPMIFFIMNDVSMAKCLTILMNNIITILYIKQYFNPHIWPFSANSIMFLVIVLLCHIACTIRRYRILTPVYELDQIEVPSYNYLNELFDKIKYEHTFHLIIQVGLQSGLHAITSQPFVGYLIGRFPKSNWLVLYVNFLTSVVWGMDDNSYKYFLHMLSINKLPFLVQLQLFETVYCYMQVAKLQSPIVKTDLNKFQEIAVQFATSIKTFWGSVADDKNKLYESVQLIHNLIEDGEKQIKIMNLKYPFCPEVALQTSIFLADFKKDFKAASKYYKKADMINNNETLYVSSYLSAFYRPFFAGFHDFVFNNIQTVQDEYTFLSICQHTDEFALRQPNAQIRNAFLSHNGNTYSAQKQHVFNETAFFNAGKKSFFYFLALTTVLLIAIVVIEIVDWNGNRSIIVEEMNIRNVAKQGRYFIDQFEALFYDMVIFSQAQLGAFYDIRSENHFEFLNFTFLHIDNMTGTITGWEHYLQSALSYVQINDIPIDRETYPFAHCTADFVPNNTSECTYFDYLNMFMVIVKRSKRDLLNPIDYSRDELYNIRTIIINTTDQYLLLLTKFVNDSLSIIFNSKLYIKIARIVIYIIIVVILCILLNYLTEHLKGDMFTIFCTLQPSIKKTVERQYDKFIQAKDQTIGMPEPKIYVNSTIFLILAFVFASIPCLILIFTTVGTTTRTLPSYYDESVIIPTLSVDGYYHHAYMEFNLLGYNNTFSTSQLRSIHIDSVCMHSYFNTTQEKTFYLPIVSILTSTGLDILYYVCLILVILSFVLFVYTLLQTIHKFESTRYLLFSIPAQAGRSNPVFKSILTNSLMSKSDIKSFISEVTKPTPQFSFFSIVTFDDNGKVTETTKNVKKLLTIQPNTMDEIIDVLSKSTIKQTEIQIFFEQKAYDAWLYGSFPLEGIEFCMKFIDEHRLFLKDERENSESNQKARRGKAFRLITQTYQREQITTVNDAAIILFRGLKPEEYVQLYQLSLSYDHVFFVDSRFLYLLFVIDVQPSEDRIITLSQTFEFVKNALPIVSAGQIAINTGSRLFINPPAKKGITKPRSNGQLYQDTVNFYLTRKYNDVCYCRKEIIDMITDEILQKSFGKKKEELSYSTFVTADNRELSFAALF